MERLSLRRIFVSCMLAASAQAFARAADNPRISDAVVAAVRQRVGAGADVVVESLEIVTRSDTAAAARVDLSPDPAAHLGGAVRFTLIVDGVRTGRVDARLHVFVERAHALRFVARGAVLDAGDVDDVRDEVVEGPLRRWPLAAELAGGRALSDLAAGRVIPPTAVAAVPAVRAGQNVTAISRALGIEAAATMVAAENGNPGAVIRVVNRTTRKALRARIVSSEVVEIIHD